MPDTTAAPQPIADAFAAQRWPAARWLTAHPRLVDAAAIVVAVAPPLAVIIAAGGAPVLAYLAVALAGLALAWRRSHPAQVLVAVSLAGALSPATNLVLALAIALYTAASRLTFGRTAAAAGISLLVSTVSTMAAQLVTGQRLIPITVLHPIALVALALGIAVRAARLQREATAQLVAERIEHERALERSRIAAEMHDVVAHSLSVMIALADGAAAGWRTRPERSAEALRHLADVGRASLTDMQRVLGLLRDSDAALDDGLRASGHNVPDLAHLAGVFRAAGLPVELTRTGEMPRDPTLATTVYRIAQEGLTNALRYAVGATRVDLEVRAAPDLVTLRLTDDGAARDGGAGGGGGAVGARGPAGSVGTGSGLAGIRTRAAVHGGTMTAGPTGTGGWQLVVTLPVPTPAATPALADGTPRGAEGPIPGDQRD